MPQTAQGSFFAPGSHTSYKGAVGADKTRAEKTRAYLRLLSMRGPLTDWEAHLHTGWERTSINSIRNGCIKKHWVTRGFTTRPGPTGNRNDTWTLTREGSAAARALEE